MKSLKIVMGIALGALLLVGCENSELKTSPKGSMETVATEEMTSGWAEPHDAIYDGDTGTRYSSVFFGGFVDEERISLIMYEYDGYVPFYYKAKVGRKISIPSEKIVIEILEMKPDEDTIELKVSKIKESE